jgi:hypothetical protein
MRRKQLLAFALLSSSAIFTSSAFSQGKLPGTGAKLTASDGLESGFLGSSVAIAGDFVVVANDPCAGLPKYYCNYPLNNPALYVYQREPRGWVNDETQVAELTPSVPGSPFGGLVAMSGDTVVTVGTNKAYVFEEPAGGWMNASEIAQLIVPARTNESIRDFLAIDGDTVVVATDKAAYIFVKPSGGWATTSAYTAKLTPPTPNGVDSIAISGDTIVLGSLGYGFVYQKPQNGWATTEEPTATLTKAVPGFLGFSAAIFGDTIALTDSQPADGYGGRRGVVDLYVKPASGWANATPTAELNPPLILPLMPTVGEFGISLALSDSHLVVGGIASVFVYSKPATGWKSGAWPSQEYNDGMGGLDSGFGFSVGIEGSAVVTGNDYVEVHGHKGAGIAYVYSLVPNWIQIPTDLLEFPNLDLGSSEVVPLTITNVGTGTLQFTTLVNVQNYHVLQTAENTCLAGVPAGQSCVLPIQYEPGGVGIHTNYLTLSSLSAASYRTIELRGVAAGVGAAKEEPLNFGDVTLGQNPIRPLVLANFGVPGSPTVEVSFSGPNYVLAPGGTCAAGVAEGQTCTLMIQFAPVTVGVHDGTIQLTPSSGPASSVVVQGVAYNP